MIVVPWARGPIMVALNGPIIAALSGCEQMFRNQFGSSRGDLELIIVDGQEKET